MYPRYSYQDVLNELAVVFFSLLNNGYRLQSQRYMLLAQIASVPHMEDGARQSFLRQLEWSAQDPSDILDTEDADSSIDGVRNLFRKI